MKLRFHWWLNKFSGGLISAYGIHTPPWVFWVLLGCGRDFYHLPPTLSSSFLGLPSWSVSRLQPPDVSSVWVACAFCPSHHPSLAEPPARVLPWLWCLDPWAFTNTLNKVKKNCCCCCCKVTSVVSNSVRPHRQQPTRLRCPGDSPGKNTGVNEKELETVKWSRSSPSQMGGGITIYLHIPFPCISWLLTFIFLNGGIMVYFILATPWGMQDLSSPIRNWTLAPCCESAKS